MADAGRSDAVTSTASVLAVLLCGAAGVDIGLAALRGPTSARWAWCAVAAWAFFQLGRAFLRLSGASVYPRANYYGAADIAPEAPGADLAGRRSSLFIGASATVATALCALTLLAVSQHVLPMAVGGLGIGAAVESALAIARRPERVERALRGNYVLYLRSFARARAMITLATALAASPYKVLAILSPRRTEVRTFGWYLLAALLPVQFE